MTVQKQEQKIEQKVEIMLPGGIYDQPRPTQEQLDAIPADIYKEFAQKATFLEEHLFPLTYTANTAMIAYKSGLIDVLDKPMTIDEIIESLLDQGKIELDSLNMDQELEAARRKIGFMFELWSTPQLRMIRKTDGEKWELTDRTQYLRNDSSAGMALAMINLNEYYIRAVLDDIPHKVFGTKAFDDIGSPEFGARYTERVPGTLIMGIVRSLPKFGVDLEEGEPVVLDCGCGTGAFLTELAEKHSQVKAIGLDYNLGSCEEGTKRAEEAKVGDRVEFRQVDLATDRIPLSDSSVDLVTALNFHHFFPQYGDQNVTNEIYRVLKKDGKYITVVATCDGPDDVLMLAVQSNFQFLFSDYTGWRKREHLQEIAQKAGFKVTKLVPLMFKARQGVFFAVKT